MPTYEYHCDACDKNFDVVQSFQDDPLDTCPTCAAPVRKVFGNVGIVFKGSGFYKTDSRSGASVGDRKGGDSADTKEGGSAGKNGGPSDAGTGSDGHASPGSDTGSESAKKPVTRTGDRSGSTGGGKDRTESPTKAPAPAGNTSSS